MADESNIYLIADDYMHSDYAPPKNGETLGQMAYPYTSNFTRVAGQYSGAADIDSSFGSKWLSIYWKSYSNSTQDSILGVAYMLDKAIWNDKYKTGYESIVDYVIGGPTLEMYCKSYKDTHPSKYLQCASIKEQMDGGGYQVKWSTERR